MTGYEREESRFGFARARVQSRDVLRFRRGCFHVNAWLFRRELTQRAGDFTGVRRHRQPEFPAWKNLRAQRSDQLARLRSGDPAQIREQPQSRRRLRQLRCARLHARQQHGRESIMPQPALIK